ncbi:hypothetical protein GCM10010096_27590 [Alcaligenes pakistanensis]|uniref:Uncharacterized protein n=1 Tax=Alcaligenes pakistanensis TaxID=1482717 RepID=A0A8H9M184_9BURK|nr:hypothetical protein GCM10010096_27590 [Alcaligenes pakistanensis]
MPQTRENRSAVSQIFLMASTNKTVLTAMARHAETARSAQTKLATAKMDRGIKELSTLVCQVE